MTVNGEQVVVGPGQASRPLLDVLRDELWLTGAKRGCGTGYCGTCTVLVDGRAVPSCLALTGLLDGCEIRTVEGLESPEGLDTLQQAFIARAGLQCGFCTPGQLMAARALLDRADAASDEEILGTVDGVYCRCTGYVKIVDSVRAARDAL